MVVTPRCETHGFTKGLDLGPHVAVGFRVESGRGEGGYVGYRAGYLQMKQGGGWGLGAGKGWVDCWGMDGGVWGWLWGVGYSGWMVE